MKPSSFSPSPHYPFGMLTPGRDWSAGSEYRFGFNGKESDAETYGDGNAYDFGARIYDARLGRWMSIDPFYKKYQYLSPYVFSVNNPIKFKDSDGNDIELKGDVNPEELRALLEVIFGENIIVKIERVQNRDFLTVALNTSYDNFESGPGKNLFDLLSTMQQPGNNYPMYLANRGTDPMTTGNYNAIHIAGNFELNLDAFTYLPESGGFSKNEMMFHEFQELKIKTDIRGTNFIYETNRKTMSTFYEEDHNETLKIQGEKYGIKHGGYVSNDNGALLMRDVDITSKDNKYLKTIRFQSNDGGGSWNYQDFTRNGMKQGDAMNKDNSLNYDTDHENYYDENK
ncbi:MAG: RHS repeat-associated core domain-containing protein [Saprospiraceae bacterium]|nr:RHS repeat-associated core domain-containing protein [Saprospiraceae bacterium]